MFAGKVIYVCRQLHVAVVAIVAMRYIGMGLNQTDLYILGGIGMGVAMIMRFFLFKGMKK
jgi:hypothetical protein